MSRVEGVAVLLLLIVALVIPNISTSFIIRPVRAGMTPMQVTTTGSLQVFVHDLQNNPVGGAWVIAFLISTSSPSPYLTGNADSAGQYTFQGLAAGNYEVSAIGNGGNGYCQVAVPEFVAVTAGQTTGVSLISVVDVQLPSSVGCNPSSIPGISPTTLPPTSTTVTTIQITANPQTVTQTSVLSGSTITVTALDQNGNPIPNVPISLTASSPGVLSPQSAMTGSNGQAESTLTLSNSVTTSVTILVQASSDNVPSQSNQVTFLPASMVSSQICGNPTISLSSPMVNDLTVTINANPQPGGSSCSITSISWSWGDGSSSTGVTGTHTYSSAANYTVIATAYQSDGKQTMSAPTSVALPGPSSFDFAVSTVGNQFAVSPGLSLTVPVTVSLTSGAPQLVSLSVSWIPAGSNQWFTTQFIPPTGIPSSGSPLVGSLDIEVASHAPPGTYEAQIFAIGGKVVKFTVITIVVFAVGSVLGVKNTLSFTSLNVQSQDWPGALHLPIYDGPVCPSTSNEYGNYPPCFSVQQNSLILVPNGTRYLGQNLIFVELDVNTGKLAARGQFEIPNVGFDSPFSSYQEFSASSVSWTLSTTLDPFTGCLTASSDLYSFGSCNPGSGIAFPAGSVIDGENELILVGDGSVSVLNLPTLPLVGGGSVFFVRTALFSAETQGTITASYEVPGVTGWQTPSLISIETSRSSDACWPKKSSYLGSCETSSGLLFSPVASGAVDFCSSPSTCSTPGLGVVSCTLPFGADCVGTASTTSVSQSATTTTSSQSSVSPSNQQIPLPSGAAFTCTSQVSPSSGTAPLAVQLSVSCSGGSQPYSYHWSFGDGSTGTMQVSTHTYSSKGVYPWGLFVIDAAGNTYSASGTLNVG